MWRRALPALIMAGMLGAVAAVPRAAQAAPLACAEEAVSEASAIKMAAVCGQPVAVDASRSEVSQVVARPDGHLTLESSVVPERARRGSAWQKINPRLGAGADGRLRPAVAVADVSFSPGGTEPLVTLIRAGKTMTMSWPGTLQSPSIMEDTATYADVFRGVDLKVRATPTGFAHTFVVRSAAADLGALREIRFQLGGEAKLRSQSNGLVAMAGNTVLATAEPAVMWDSRKGSNSASGRVDSESTPAGAGELARTAPVDVSVSGSDLVLRPDESLLGADDTTYPLYIDPTWSVYKNKWAYATNNNSNNTDYKVARVGHNPDTGALYRSFFQFPTTANGVSLKGKHVESARVEMTLDHSWSCDKTVASMYWSSAIAATMRSTWSKMGLTQFLDTATGRANEAGGCANIQADMVMNFQGATVTGFLQKAANGGWANLTVGFTARDADGAGEATQNRWKKFLPGKAKLFVDYDTKPGTPTNLQAAGVACGSSVLTIGTLTPTFSAVFPDGDKSDSLTGVFEWVEVPAAGIGAVTATSPARKGAPANKTSVSPGARATTAAVTAAKDKTFAFRARGIDKAPYSISSGWSAWCQFKVDITVPVVTATVVTKPAGPGQKGRIRISSTSTDVTKFQYGWDAATKVVLATGTNPKVAEVDVTAQRFGLNVLLVKAIDATLNEGVGSVEFDVSRPSIPIARWGLETYPGVTQADALADRVPAPSDSPLTATTVTWAGDVRLRGGQTATFNGASSGLTTAGPVVNTTGSFSVAGWARLAAMPTTDAKFAVQEGTDASGFELGIRRVGTTLTPYWSFVMKDTAAQSSTAIAVTAPAAVTTADLGRWIHVAGVFDAAEKKVRLYVNGVQVAQADRTATPWAANGKFAVGRGFSGGVTANFWNGSLADVQVYDRVLVPQDFTGQVASAEDSSGFDEPGIVTPTRVGAWNFEAATPCYVADLRDTCEAPDDSTTSFGRYLALTRGAEVGAGHTASGQGLWLDSDYFPDTVPSVGEVTSEYGRSAAKTGTTAPDADGNQFSTWQDQPVLRTDLSFTVSAWVKLDEVSGTGNRAVLAQAGAHESATWLRYDTAAAKWEFGVLSADASTGSAANAESASPAETGVWTHLTGVYDDARHEAQLYVNGMLEDTKAVPFTPMTSDGPLLVGRTRGHDKLIEQWSGGIDNVAIYQGAMTDGAVAAMFDMLAAVDSGSNVLSVDQTMAPGDTLQTSDGGYTLTMQVDGNLVLHDDTGGTVWSTKTQQSPGAWLAMQNDGNLVLYSSTATPLWSTRTSNTAAQRLILYDDGDLALLDAAGQVVWRR
jgi:Concanavalin A-like lectin/glucanases superfamily